MSLRKNRRVFLESTGFAGAALLGSSWLSAARAIEENPTPDLVVINARIATMDAARPEAQAFAVRAGRFTAVGATADIRSLAGPKTRIYDAKGMFITPGFADTHNHGDGETLLYDVLVGNPYEVEFVTIDSIVDKLKAKARTLPPGTWVHGYYHDDTKLKDRRQLNVHDLDKVSSEHPVHVHHRGGHTSFYNSVAFKLAGITKNTPNPFGGIYDKDARGELSGRVTDRARLPISKIGKEEVITPAQKDKRRMDGVAFISKKFSQYGLVHVHHNERGVLEAMQEQRRRGNLLHRVSFEPYGELLEAMITTGIQSGFGDDWIRFGNTSEHGVDGSLSERTMAISRPYLGITPPFYGTLVETQEDLNQWCERVHRANIRITTHANGDVAIDRTLTACERALKLYPRADARPKINHCSYLNADLIRRIKAIGATPSEFSTYAYYNSDKFVFYGEDMMKNMMPYRDLLDAGIKPSTGSDFQPGPFAPLMAIQGMVTRKGWDGRSWGVNQRITVDEAILCSTLHGVRSACEEKDKGSITPGKLADYVVMAEDLRRIDPDKIKDVKIVQTVVDGVARYQA